MWDRPMILIAASTSTSGTMITMQTPISTTRTSIICRDRPENKEHEESTITSKRKDPEETNMDYELFAVGVH